MTEHTNIPDISFTPGSAHHSYPIEVITLQSLRERKTKGGLDHDPEAPHRVEFYLLIQIEEGYGEQFIDFHKYPFEPNSLIFINKHQINAFDFGQNPKGRIILFTDDFMTQVQASMPMPLFSPFYLSSHWEPVFTPQLALQQRCQVLIQQAEQELQHKDSREMIVMLLFSALLMMIMRDKSMPEDSLNHKQFAIFRQFGTLLNTHFTETREAGDYADWLNITYKTLNLACKQICQQTAKQVIDHYTILEAKRRLILSGQPIQQLSDELGFDEPSNFVKYFKKHTGLTPSRFKQSPKA